MKRKLVMILIMLLIYTAFGENKNLKPLNNSEFLSLNYSKGVLEVFNNAKDEKELYFKINARWGAYQISGNKKKVLIYSDKENNYYLLDGEKGEFGPFVDRPMDSMSSFDFNYLIWQKENENLSSSDMPNIVIMDLIEKKDLFEIAWKELERDFKSDASFSYLFLRSNESQYDFFVYAVGEDNVYGIMKINVDKRIINKNSFKGNDIPDYSPEYYGLE